MGNKHAPLQAPAIMSDEALLKKLYDNGTDGADLSPGDPVALAAYNRIVYLEGMLQQRGVHVPGPPARAPEPQIEWGLTWEDYFEQMLADFKALAVTCIQSDSIKAAEVALNAFHKLCEVRGKLNHEYIGDWLYKPAKRDE